LMFLIWRSWDWRMLVRAERPRACAIPWIWGRGRLTDSPKVRQARLSDATKEYLAAGGVITQLPPEVPYCRSPSAGTELKDWDIDYNFERLDLLL